MHTATLLIGLLFIDSIFTSWGHKDQVLSVFPPVVKFVNSNFSGVVSFQSSSYDLEGKNSNLFANWQVTWHSIEFRT